MINETGSHKHSQERVNIPTAGSDELKAPGVRQVTSILRANRFVIGTFVIAAAALTLLYSFFAVPEYRSSVTISVIVNKPYQTMTEFNSEIMHQFDDTTNKVNTLTEYFQSSELAENVLRAVLDKGYGPVPLFVEPGIKNILTNLGLLKRLSLDEVLAKRTPERAASDLMSYLNITPDLNFTAVTIKCTTPNPYFSAFLANEAASALLALNQKMGLRRTTEVKAFLSRQEGDLGEKLRILESKLTDFQSKNKIVSIDDTEKITLQTIDLDRKAVVETEVLLKTNEKLIADARKSMAEVRNNISNPSYDGSDLYLSQMQHRLSMLQYQVAVAQQNPQGRSADEVKALRGELEDVAKTYKRALEVRGDSHEQATMTPLEYYQFLEQSLSTLKKDSQRLTTALEVHQRNIAEQEAALPKLAETRQQLTSLKREISLTSELYLTLKKKLQETEIQEAGTINDLSVLNQAVVPQSPHAAPLSMKLVFAILVGLFFGFLVVLVREALIPTVRGDFDLQTFGMPVLGEIPVSGHYRDKPSIVVNDMPKSYEADTLRSLRLRLATLMEEHSRGRTGRAKIVQITSPRTGNGKTFIAVNLATVLAKANFKTLLVDLDLRRPCVHQYLGDSYQVTGIGDLTVSSAKEEIDAAVVPISPFLDVLFSGRRVENASEFLDSPLLEHIISAERSDYDYIVIDTPPMLGVIDPVLVASSVDAVLMVMEHRKTLREDISYSQALLHEANSKPIFAVINRVHREFTLLGLHPESAKYFDESSGGSAANAG